MERKGFHWDTQPGSQYHRMASPVPDECHENSATRNPLENVTYWQQLYDLRRVIIINILLLTFC